jgi:2-hydroxycyclohexanecarboxyl-CoA dehydrogenase
MNRLTGRVAIVTGASKGIGRGIARTLAAEGAAVSVSSRTLADVEKVASEIRGEGGRALATSCDVNIRAEVDEAVRRTVETFGGVDILVNNAQGGGRGHHPLDSVTDEVFLAAFQGGAMSSLYAMQACFPYLRENGGTVVNFASQMGVLGHRGYAPYGTAKEAVRALTKHAANEWGRHGITVNVICPAAHSDSVDRFATEPGAALQKIIRQIPLGYLGDPAEDIGPSIVALATDLHYVTGATLMLDGGLCILR